MVLKATLQKQSSKQSLTKANLKNCPETNYTTLDSYFQSNDYKYQLPHTWFDQISDHKHDIYLNGTLSSKLLAQVGHKNTMFLFTKT